MWLRGEIYERRILEKTGDRSEPITPDAQAIHTKRGGRNDWDQQGLGAKDRARGVVEGVD